MKKRPLFVTTFLLFVIILIVIALNFESALAEGPKKIRTQTVYVPVYSHIVLQQRGKTTVDFDLLINLSIRNTDLKNPITVMAADYYDSAGVLVKNYVAKPMTLKPMASTYFLIEQIDKSGGWGANFLIKWKSEIRVNEPIIESVTYGSRGTQSISFISRGKVIREGSEN